SLGAAPVAWHGAAGPARSRRHQGRRSGRRPWRARGPFPRRAHPAHVARVRPARLPDAEPAQGVHQGATAPGRVELDVRRHVDRHRACPAAAGETGAGPDDAAQDRHRVGGRIPVRTGGRMSSGRGSLALIYGIEPSDVEFILEWTLVSALVITVLGVVVLRLLATRSVRVMVLGVVLVSALTSMAGVAVIARRMLPGVNQGVVDYLMSIAGLAGIAAALIVGRQLIKASRALSNAVQGVGENGVYIAPDRVLPSELSELSDGLAAAHERLTAARTRERALEASRRELVAWVSHDLRTPLAGLRAMAEALEDQVVIDPRTVNQYHTQIRTEVDRLSTMIDDLFELSRIHAGALRLSRRMVGLEDVVAEVVASAEPLARAKGVRLTGAAVRGMPIYADSAELGRALRNLVTNAI